MHQWYLSYDGERIGPLGHAQAVAEAYQQPEGYAWREGFTDWVPIAKVSELEVKARPRAPAPPPAGRRAADEVDFVTIGLHFQRRILTGLFGGEGFVMQKLEGDGLVCLHAGGTVSERQLASGERLQVDTGCVVALEATVGFDVESVGGIESALLAGEGLFLANLAGPGRVWLQSLPFSRLAGRMLANRTGREEGSLLGPLGGIVNGR